MNRYLTIVLLAFTPMIAMAQSNGVTIRGMVSCDDKDVLGIAQVFIENTGISTVVNDDGYFELKDVPKGKYTIVAYAIEHQADKKIIEVTEDLELKFHLHEFELLLEEVSVTSAEENTFGFSRLNAVDGVGIYEGKKTEVIVIDDIIANKAANTTRQIFSRVSGLNIWESDCAGIQLGVGGRGLSPNRSSNFNTRQNGIEMSADALGYPESYYAPPIQAVEEIEVVRGAASLQYGSQFGGLINFQLKDAPENDPFELETSLTYGQYDYINSFTSAGGTKGKVSYYTYFQYRSGDCWRENSGFDALSAFGKVTYRPNTKNTISWEYSKMHYRAQQPGGLTDAQFNNNPQASTRERNWFDVDWNLMSVQWQYKPNPKTTLDSRVFALVAGRDALGNLTSIDRADNKEFDRTLIRGDFFNLGNETRLLHRYEIGETYGSFVTGFRVYKGTSENLEGTAPQGSLPDFYFIQADSLNYDYSNTGINYSLFAENIVYVNDRISITPGIRWEHIETTSRGYFRRPMPTDLAGNPLLPPDTDLREFSAIAQPRDFLIGGVGVSYKWSNTKELYSNVSQNYKSVSFSDIRVTVPALVVDPEISDERGYSADLGIRGTHKNHFSYDVTGFALRYLDRIGTILQRDEDFRVYRYKSNLGDALNLGVESYVEWDFSKWRNANANHSLSLFVNLTYLNTRYTSGSSQIVGNAVEFSPQLNLRSGLTFKKDHWGMMIQYSYLSDQFSDASNAPNSPPVPGAVEGTIPAYYVMDFTVDYTISSMLKLSGSINNFTNHRYFTRRATGYPGPGIIPSDGINGNLTLTASF